jgi:hypothetical protein
MDLEQFSVPAIVVTCAIIGTVIKQTNYIKDNFIPLISVTAGVILSFLMELKDVSTLSVFDIVVRGIASGASATGLHQVVKQLTEKG